MKQFLYRIFRQLGRSIPKIDWGTALITILSTLIIIFAYSFNFTPFSYLERLAEFTILPMLVILLVFREKLADYGLRLGDWKAGMLITVAAIILMVPILYWVVRSSPALIGFYADQMTPLFFIPILVEMIGWEFLCRGFLLFGYEKIYGANALWLQAVPFALAHLGKPSLETFTTIFGGFAFGWVAWRTRSVLYPFLIHSFVTIFTILVASGKI
jgi:membrane protease YdiL (CAAX protease family)